MSKPLTPKQEKFTQLVADGNTQADAYRGAFGQGNQSDKTIIEKASKQMATDNIRARVAQLKETLSNRELWTREQSVNKLKEAYDIADRPTDIVAITKELNAMHGYNAPVKMEVEHKGAVNIFVPEQSDDE
jgi:carbonic anhydrase